MANIPGFDTATGTAMNDIQSQLKGTLSPGTMGTLQDKAAAFGVGAGTPFTGTSGLPLSNFLQAIGTSSEGLANQGVSNYLNFGSLGANTQLSPELQTSLSQSNAVLNSAPDPSAAVGAEQAWTQQYANMMNANRPSGGGGYGGGFGGTTTAGYVNGIPGLSSSFAGSGSTIGVTPQMRTLSNPYGGIGGNAALYGDIGGGGMAIPSTPENSGDAYTGTSSLTDWPGNSGFNFPYY